MRSDKLQGEKRVPKMWERFTHLERIPAFLFGLDGSDAGVMLNELLNQVSEPLAKRVHALQKRFGAETGKRCKAKE